MPPEVYEKLAETAEREHRSLAQQAVVLLSRALGLGQSPKQRRGRVLDKMAKAAVQLDFPPGATPEDLIREDRER